MSKKSYIIKYNDTLIIPVNLRAQIGRIVL